MAGTRRVIVIGEDPSRQISIIMTDDAIGVVNGAVSIRGMHEVIKGSGKRGRSISKVIPKGVFPTLSGF